jgi:hypothetical protein
MSEQEQSNMELIVDTVDSYLGLDNVFYLHPQRLNLAAFLEDKAFDYCTIKNSPIDNLTSLNLAYVFRKLKPLTTCEVIIQQPISVMQEYDAKQIEANARLAGFEVSEIADFEYVDAKTERKVKTKRVLLSRPERKANMVEVEIEVKKEDGKKATATVKDVKIVKK